MESAGKNQPKLICQVMFNLLSFFIENCFNYLLEITKKQELILNYRKKNYQDSRTS